MLKSWTFQFAWNIKLGICNRYWFEKSEYRDNIDCESDCPCNKNCQNGCIDCDNIICKDSILILNTFSSANLPIHLDFKGFVFISTHKQIVRFWTSEYLYLNYSMKPKFKGNSKEVDFEIELGTEGQSENEHYCV